MEQIQKCLSFLHGNRFSIAEYILFTETIVSISILLCFLIKKNAMFGLITLVQALWKFTFLLQENGIHDSYEHSPAKNIINHNILWRNICAHGRGLHFSTHTRPSNPQPKPKGKQKVWKFTWNDVIRDQVCCQGNQSSFACPCPRDPYQRPLNVLKWRKLNPWQKTVAGAINTASQSGCSPAKSL